MKSNIDSVETRVTREWWPLLTVELRQMGTQGVLTINVPVVYFERDVMILMWATSFTQAIGRGVWALPFQAQKSLDFQGPPLPMARVMDLPTSMSVQIPYKKQVHW
jgi:hypothetical protein